MDRSDSGFSRDWQSKCDFTASTVNYFRKMKCMGLMQFFEKDALGNLVPFGDPSADVKSRMDVYMCYMKAVWFVFELKERRFGHTNRLVIDPNEGEFMNPEKKDEMQRIKDEKFFKPFWVALYEDGKIRIWNLWKIDLQSMRSKMPDISKTTVYGGPKYPQLRYLFNPDDSIVIDRIKGGNEQGDNRWQSDTH